MRFKIKYIFAPLLFLFGLHVYAEYKTTDFTQEEYQMVIKTSGEYTNCLNETAISQVESQSDVRIIADYAMKQCASILEMLYQELVSANYDPKAVRRLVGSTSNRASNKLLSNLMRYRASPNQ
jgi:hypothetical protein|tara:strand:+ start:291 stop:659 length:369 start_codon:yes stop_codon:yes gene_type:complete